MDCEERVTRDEWHLLLHRWQPAWLRTLPQPLYEMLSGVLVIPLLFIMPWYWSLAVFVVVSGIYERVFPGYKFTDELWRFVGAAFAVLGWLL
jgi:hypothetical protein